MNSCLYLMAPFMLIMIRPCIPLLEVVYGAHFIEVTASCKRNLARATIKMLPTVSA